MEKKDLTQKVLADIKQKNIKPKAKWQFTVKNILFAGFLALFLAFGSFAFSIMLFLLINNDWDLRHLVAKGLLAFLISTFPYIWIILFIIFLVLSFVIFRKMRGSYRFKYSLVLLLGVVAVLVIGSILHRAGVSKIMDLTLRKHIPIYQDIIEKRNKIWLNPEQGVLIGKVLDGEKNYVYILDPKNRKWKVNIENISEEELIILKSDFPVKIIGTVKKEGLFEAERIRIAPKGFYLQKMNIQIPLGNNTFIERNIYQMRNI
jgi:hypothetical protein